MHPNQPSIRTWKTAIDWRTCLPPARVLHERKNDPYSKLRKGRRQMQDTFEVGPASVKNYKTFLMEPSRPPSRGGNTRALHQHSFEVDDERYSFLAVGGKRWIFASDTAMFRWEWDDSKRYRNVLKDTLRTTDKSGSAVVRGDRSFKKKLRTATTRLPGSRREQRD